MIVSVQVKPNSRKGNRVELKADRSFLVFLKEPAVEGKANAALIIVLAEHFNIPKSQIRIKSGDSSKHKLVVINE